VFWGWCQWPFDTCVRAKVVVGGGSAISEFEAGKEELAGADDAEPCLFNFGVERPIFAASEELPLAACLGPALAAFRRDAGLIFDASAAPVLSALGADVGELLFELVAHEWRRWPSSHGSALARFLGDFGEDGEEARAASARQARGVSGQVAGDSAELRAELVVVLRRGELALGDGGAKVCELALDARWELVLFVDGLFVFDTCDERGFERAAYGAFELRFFARRFFRGHGGLLGWKVRALIELRIGVPRASGGQRPDLWETAWGGILLYVVVACASSARCGVPLRGCVIAELITGQLACWVR